MEFSKLRIFDQNRVKQLEQTSTKLERQMIGQLLFEDYDRLISIPSNDRFYALTRATDVIEANLPSAVLKKAEEAYTEYMKKRFGDLRDQIDDSVHQEYIELIKRHIKEGTFDEYAKEPFHCPEHISFNYAHEEGKLNLVRIRKMEGIIIELGDAISNYRYDLSDEGSEENKEILLHLIEKFHKEAIFLKEKADEASSELQGGIFDQPLPLESYVQRVLGESEGTKLLAQLNQALQKAVHEDADVKKMNTLLKEASDVFDEYYNVCVNDSDMVPSDDIIFSVAEEFGIPKEKIDTYSIADWVLDQSEFYMRDYEDEGRYDKKDFEFVQGYIGQYYLEPKSDLFDSEYPPEPVEVELYDFVAERILDEGPEEISRKIHELENEGLSALYNEGEIKFIVGGESYEDPTDAIDAIETWLKQMKSIRAYKLNWDYEATTESMKNKLDCFFEDFEDSEE